jgi:putative nucleotidyltransferase with HDIG domain
VWERGGDLNGSAFISLVYNAALLLVLVFLYDLIARYLRHQSALFKLLTGLVLGLISIAVMLAAWHLSSGVIFDTRSVVLSMGTLFYGTVPGLIAGAIAAIYRASRGGDGVVMGVSVIAMSVIVGALWRRWRHVARRDPSLVELYLFGLTVHVLMLVLTATLPDPWTTLRQIALPVIVIYPFASVLLGMLMIDQRRRRRAERTLRESEQRYRSLFEDSPVAMWEEDDSAVKAFLESHVAGGDGDVIAYLLDHPEEYSRCVELSRTLDANKAAIRLFEADSRDELLARNSDLYRRESDRGIYRFWAAMLSGERSATFEEANLSLKGQELHVLETCTVVPGHEDTYDRVYIADVDVTERREAEEQIRRHADQLHRTVGGAVLAMSSVVEVRDPYTAGHQRRVAELAVAIAVEMGASEAEVEGLRLAALIHDLGKLVVPAEILAKPGRLTADEFTLIKQHSQAGHDIIRSVEFERPVAEIVLQHHERLDGSGYPRGLSDDGILLESRIIAVADVYEAMVSHRPYRAALPEEDALAELREGAGDRYDAQVVAACLRLLERGFAFSSIQS